MGFQEARQYMRERFSASGGLRSPENCLNVMVDAVREVSKSFSEVGADCMCVHIQGASPRVTVSFRPKATYRIGTTGGDLLGPIAFTPYVIARDMVARPSLSSNKMFMATPGVDIRFEAGPTVPIDQQPALLQHLDRPDRPRGGGRP
jgi:hypothetical protein